MHADVSICKMAVIVDKYPLFPLCLFLVLVATVRTSWGDTAALITDVGVRLKKEGGVGGVNREL